MIKLNRAVAGILRVVPVIAVVLFFVFNRSYPLWFEFLNSGLGTVGSALVFIVTISAVCFAATYNNTAIEVDARAYADERAEYYLELAGNHATEGDS